MENIYLENAKALASYMEEIFYHLHRHPELGNQEYNTQALILEELAKMGIDAEKIADTGVVGIIWGGKPGKTVAFRADMDALPVQEETDLPYRSQIDGVMHACGHDAHVTILLGFAKMMAACREEIHGNIKLFFQPAEEKNGGAERMIAAGCMENPHVDAVFFSHCSRHIPVGTIHVRSGAVSAASNAFTVTYRGKGCHGAYPHRGIDPITAACQAVTALQTICSRRIPSGSPAVITVGSIHAGTAPNIVPEEAVFSGTIRTVSPATRKKAVESLEQVVRGIAAAMDVEVDLVLREGYAATINDDAMVELTRSAGRKVLGDQQVITTPATRLGAEDFAYFCEQAPGCYFNLGVASDRHPHAPAHNPRFIVDPEALPYGAAVYAQIAMDFLSQA